MKITRSQLKQIIKEEMDYGDALRRGAKLFDAYKEKAAEGEDAIDSDTNKDSYDVQEGEAESDLGRLVYKMGLNPPEEEIIKTIKQAWKDGYLEFLTRQEYGDGDGMYENKMKITNSQLKQIIKEELEKVVSENEDDKAIALQHIKQFNQMVDDGTAVETAKKIIAKRLNRATGRPKDDEFGKGYADRAAMMRQYGG